MNSTILNIILFVLACAIPFLFVAWRSRNQEKRKLEALANHPLIQGNPLSQYDIHHDFVIALAEEGNLVCFWKYKSGLDPQIVKLDAVLSCRVDRVGRSSVDGKFSSMEKIELRFETRSPSDSVVVFDLYNMERDSLSVSDELVIAEKWCSLVKQRLMSTRSRAKSA